MWIRTCSGKWMGRDFTFWSVECINGKGNRSFWLVKRPKGANRYILWLAVRKSRKIKFWFCYLLAFKDNAFKAVKRDTNSKQDTWKGYQWSGVGLRGGTFRYKTFLSTPTPPHPHPHPLHRRKGAWKPSFSNSSIIQIQRKLMVNECLRIRWKTAHFCILNFSW